MPKAILIPILALFSIYHAFSQCPSPPYQVADTVCPQQTVVFANPAQPGEDYDWDFCPGDLKNTPEFTPVAIPPGLGFSPEQLKIVEDGGNFHCFIANNGFNYLVRADFGNSLNNIPTYDTLSHNNLITGLTGVDLVKENGSWKAFVVVNAPASLVRLDLDSITDSDPVFTNLGLTGMISPLEVKVIDHFAFIADLSAGLVRYDFQGSYSNVPVIVNPTITAPTLFGIDVKYDCNSSSYFAFVSSAGNGGVSIFDFGNDLSSTPVALPVITTSASPRAVSVAREAGEWYMSVIHAGNGLVMYHFNDNIYNTPTIIADTTFGGLAFSTSFSCQLIKDSSQWHCFAVNVSNSQLLSHVYFPDSCNSQQYFASAEPSNISYPSTGNYYFELTVTDSNHVETTYYDSIAIEILPPAADFTWQSSCINTPVQFTDASFVCFGTIASWTWDFGDSNTSNTQHPAHVYTAAGSYTVSLTVHASNGDSGVHVTSVNVAEYPVASFTASDSICANAPLVFTDNSVAPGDTITQWLWNFGDGNSSTDQNPSHAYTTAGAYDVMLIAGNSSNCMDSANAVVVVMPSPLPFFSAMHSCVNESTQFINSTDSSGLNAVSYFWSFGDSTFSTDALPDHIYNATGSYPVSLIATGDNGCIDSIVTQVSISNKPDPSFSVLPSTACTGSSVLFTDNSTVTPGDSIVYRLWDFGDLTTDTLAIQEHIYTSPGNFTVELTIATADFCDTSITASVEILQSPDAAFIFANECFGTPLSFVNQSTAASGDPISGFTWELGDSTTLTSFNVTHAYANPGIYNVTLVATSMSGCSDTASATVQSFHVPQADFTNYPMLCTDTGAVFIDLSSVTDDTINTWLWDFGDGGTSGDQHPVHIYTTPGPKLVTLTSTTINNCSSTISHIIDIKQSPAPSISFTPSCFGQQTCFTAADTNNPPNIIDQWQWNFGDSSLSQIQNPCHNYNYAADFTLTLLVSDTSGCSKMISVPVPVHPLPNAGFTSSQACTGSNIQFDDTSNVMNGSIVAWSWLFNNAAGGNNMQAFFSTNNAGTLPVQLTVTSDKGCTDSATRFIEVHTSPLASYVISPLFSAPGETVNFNNQSTNADTYLWTFGDGSSPSILASPSHAYQDTGIYFTTLIAANSDGCTDTISRNHTVLTPETDIAIININASEVNGMYRVSAVLFNAGNVDISNFEIVASFDNMSPIHEFPEFSLPLSTPKTYAFYSSIGSGSFNPGYLCIETFRPNGVEDADLSNNRLCMGFGEELQVFNTHPNPAGNSTTVNFILPAKGIANLAVVDDKGSMVISQSIAGEKGFNSVELNTTSLKSGSYALMVDFNDERKFIRFAKL